MPFKTNVLASWCCTVLFLLLSSSLLAQKSVTGRVISNADKQPIVGATVQVKGTKLATQTGTDGSFSISSPKEIGTLIVTVVGFEALQIPVSGRASIGDVVLSLSATSLNDVVVTGYTAQRKKDITGSVAVVNIKELKQLPVGTGEEALQGRASGVTIVSSGQPGGASDIRIRGITGFGDNTPLIIVDGVRGAIHDINVNDIESMQVLKDASAAIYGVAGSNGVIIITTKKGKSGKAKISYDGYVGVTTPGPGYKMANTQQEANAIWQQQHNSGIDTPSHAQFGKGFTPVIPDYITPAGAKAGDPGTDPALYDINSHQITKANKIGTDWYKEITRNAFQQSHNLSVSAGSDKSSYYFSFGYLDQQGIAQFQYNKRYSVRANTQFSIKDHIRVGENAYIFYKQNPRFGNQGEGSPFSVVFREDAIIPVYDIKGNFAGTKSQGLGNAQNPYANIYRSKDNRNHDWNVSGNVYAEADFLKHFTIRTSFGGVLDNNYNYSFSYVGYENAEGNTGANSFTEGAGYGSNYTFTNTLNYSNTFGNHNVRVLIGTEAISNYFRYENATRSNYFSQNPNYWTVNTGSPTGVANSGGAGQSSLWSQFARVEYSYAGKYLVNASMRRDGSSLFTESVRFGYFPAVSVAWRISQESFFKNITFVNDLKLRYSWAKLGSTGAVISTNPYNLYASTAGHSYYAIDGSSTVPTAGFYKSNIGNPATSWEGDIISNVGLDATILHNKLDFTIDWYKKKISGLLFTASGTRYDRIFTGDVNLPQVNVGDMQNTGIDFNMTYHGAVGRDFKFDITGMVTSYTNKIVSIPGLPYFEGPTVRNVIIQRNQVGHSFGEFFGYKVQGLFQTADEVTKAPAQDDKGVGLFRYADVNKDGKIDANDRTFIGNPNPKFTYGINIAFSYKNFDFSSFFFGSQGNDIFDQTKYFTDFPDFFKGGIRRDVALNAWTPTHTNTDIPKLRTTGGSSTDGVTNSYFVSKGSYFRCKQMQIGYNLPTGLLSKVGIDHLRVYIQGANLFTITKYKGLDPELSSQPDSNNNIPKTYQYGIDQGNYPHTPAFLFGVNLTF